MRVNEITYQSPHWTIRYDTSIDLIVVHHTDGSFPGCAEWMCDPSSKVSAHYLITKEGSIYQLVPDEKAAYHCGYSEWDVDDDGRIGGREKNAWLNQRSIGIELEGFGNDFSDRQREELWALLRYLVVRYDVKLRNIVGHKDIAPGRKSDPEGLDLEYFRKALEE